MLSFLSNRQSTDCDGSTRRDFLKAGTLGMSGLMLPDLLRARASAAAAGQPARNTSVVWLWLSGGPTHVETFDPKMTAPAEFRSVTGAVQTNVAGIEIGATLPKMAQVADKMAFVRSFAHSNSGHGGGTHWVMTGYNFAPADNGGGRIQAWLWRHPRPAPRGHQSHYRPADLCPHEQHSRRRHLLARLQLQPVRRGRQRPCQHESPGSRQPSERSPQPAPRLWRNEPGSRSQRHDSGDGRLRNSGVRSPHGPGTRDLRRHPRRSADPAGLSRTPRWLSAC